MQEEGKDLGESVACLNSVVVSSCPHRPCQGLLFSGSWCYWCRDFRPKLAKVYNEYKGTELEFEVIFCSSDRDEDSMKSFYAEMPWLALEWQEQSVKKRLSQEYGVQVGVMNRLLPHDISFSLLTGDSSLHDR